MSSNILEKTVLDVHHWTDSLFTLKLTRDPGFRFESGQFAMIGLMVDGRPLMRAYSMASAAYEDHLEFLSIKVPGGPLTSRLQHVRPGDTILVNKKTTGTLILDNLLPGKRLYLLATGTGLAPFLSIIKDPAVYDRFEHQGRITDLARSGRLFEDLGTPFITPEEDRVMICGNPNMMTELAAWLHDNGFHQGSNAGPGHYVIEKAFAEK